MWFMFVIPFVIFFVIFLSIAGSLFRSHKHVKDVTKDIATTISAFPETYEPVEVFIPVTPESKEEDKTCEYCGSKIKSGETKCDACGAKVKK